MPRPDPVPQRQIANPNAWARYRVIMRWMTVLAIVCVLVSLAYVRWATGALTLQMGIAVAAGVFLTVTVGTGLMSLVFLSAGSGHDEAAADPFDERPR
jgi:hypothetical protein